MSRTRNVQTFRSLPLPLRWGVLVTLLLSLASVVTAFTPVTSVSRVDSKQQHVPARVSWQNPQFYPQDSSTVVLALGGSNGGDEETTTTLELAESDQVVVGVFGTVASLIVFYSEFTLKTTGCGLPAGPLGIWGLAEGLSYVSVTGLVAYSLVTKLQTGSGLPAGPGGLLGAAEGLSYLAIVVGLVVLALQITNYGYIPNAIPMEGGMCS